jgi:glutamate racemase
VDELFSCDPLIDTIILGCTHYPLLLDKINMYVPAGVRVLPQGNYVAESLMDYLRRHEDMQKRLSTGGTLSLLTTEHPQQFNDNASIFLNHPVDAITVSL